LLPILVAVSMAVAATLSSQESPRPAGGGLADRFLQLDRYGDGKISAEEFPGSLFKQMDKDSDGFVTVAEAREYYRSRTARQAAPAAPPANVVSPERVNTPPGPAAATPSISASRVFTDLRFARDGQPGTKDDRGQWIGGTETIRFPQHQDKQFVSTGVWMDLPYFEAKGEQPWTGPRILVKESAQAPWRVDMSFPLAIRVDAMISATFNPRIGRRCCARVSRPRTPCCARVVAVRGSPDPARLAVRGSPDPAQADLIGSDVRPRASSPGGTSDNSSAIYRWVRCPPPRTESRRDG
jgi:hypothetical protein